MATTKTTTLSLPRPLVNKIITHAQHHEQQQTCGLISQDKNQHLFFQPLPASTAATGCFTTDNAAFKLLHTDLAEKHQTLLAWVFSAEKNSSTAKINDNRFPQDQCYYLITSLDTKGVIDIQAYYRDANDLHKVTLLLS